MTKYVYECEHKDCQARRVYERNKPDIVYCLECREAERGLMQPMKFVDKQDVPRGPDEP